MPASSPDADVLIIGAGASGLAALGELSRAGVRVLCVEAQGRIGGRIRTVRDPFSPVPIELGPEFIHGRPAELWEIIRSAPLTIYETEESSVHAGDSRGNPDNPPVWRLMSDLRKAAERSPDMSFADFLVTADYSDQTKAGAKAYVEGFNAAHAATIGIAGLAEDARASAAIDGGVSFRILNGYDFVPQFLASTLSSRLLLNAIVESIEWKKSEVTVHVRSGVTGDRHCLRARKVLISVPLGVLQAGAIRFTPEPRQMVEAWTSLAFGQVFRVVLRFDEEFWRQDDRFAGVGFWFSDEDIFPTWWTTLPVQSPLLVGWSAGANADPLLGLNEQEVKSKSLENLSRITNVPVDQLRPRLKGAYFHNWHTDPFALGAYSYVPTGALPARTRLTEPVEDTLYFAGEATDLKGHSATVHGAIATGVRAAQQILATRA